jgi:ferric-dicitrate binding protein FerR (iron transport regulator)
MNWEDINWEKYRNGTATKEELEQIEAYLMQAAHPGLIGRMEQDMEEGPNMPTALASRILNQQQQRRPVRRLGQWAAAAAVAVLLCTGYYLFRPAGSKQPAAVLAVTGFDTIANTGQTAQLVHMPDSSRVWLNRGARIYINRNFRSQRLVQVEGEACFDVIKNKQLPFVVQAGAISTTVLGTVFNVETYADTSACISLIQGSVKVAHPGTEQAVILSPGEMAIAGGSTKSISRQRIGVADAAAWIKGELVFNQVSLRDALNKLGRFYGKEIHASGALLKDKTITAVYAGNEDWEKVLQHLLFVYQLHYRIQNNNTISIY